MKKTMFITMFWAAMLLTACSINDPYSEYLNEGGFNWAETVDMKEAVALTL